MDIRTREAIRYLGYGQHAVDDQTLALIESSFMELRKVADKRIVYRIFELKNRDESALDIGQMHIESRNLAKNLSGCGQVILLGATLGIALDLLIKKYSLTDMSKAVVMQACGAAFLEEFLDDWQKEMAEQLNMQEKYLRTRFSPGYGDFNILHQKDILLMLDSAKKIGLSMTDAYMLTPSKSVTAVIGISTEDTACNLSGCESCDKLDCIYRRSHI